MRKTQNTIALRRACVCSLFAALLCILSPFAIPIGPVPVSLSLFAVLLCAALLGPISASISVSVYLLLGAVGLPVFSSGMGGFGVLIGPTGGYLWSYLPMCLLSGVLYRVLFRKKLQGWMKKTILGFLTGLPGLMVCYLLGTIQYMLVARVSFGTAIVICVLPFLLFDLLKILLVGILAHRLHRIPSVQKIFY